MSSAGVIATSTFTAVYGGESVEIAAGEWLIADHELVKQHPDLFRPDALPLGTTPVSRCGRRRRATPNHQSTPPAGRALRRLNTHDQGDAYA